MSRTTAINVLGTGILLVFAAGANAGGVVELTDAQLDAVTAGGAEAALVPLATITAQASAAGQFAFTSAGTKVETKKLDPSGLPPVANTYTTLTSGVAIAGGLSPDGSQPTSESVDVQSSHQSPFTTYGFSTSAAFETPVGRVQGGAAYYVSGIWLSHFPPNLLPSF
jgi:hypothetical protein